jgi:protocatechuate 3,4-dioxygenase, beta subunit
MVMKYIHTISILFILVLNACAQSSESDVTGTVERSVGGLCQGCEAVFEYGARKLHWVDTLPDYNDAGPRLEVEGTIYHADGKTPAPGIILYVYHTDQEGIYPTRGDENGWAKNHGYIRGWVRTNAEGKYRFYTLKPGAYPGGGNPSHIHPVIKEPGVQPYWIDEFLFEGDPYITDADRKRLPQRGGNGIVKIQKRKDGMLTVQRDIILGMNVPGY